MRQVITTPDVNACAAHFSRVRVPLPLKAAWRLGVGGDVNFEPERDIIAAQVGEGLSHLEEGSTTGPLRPALQSVALADRHCELASTRWQLPRRPQTHLRPVDSSGSEAQAPAVAAHYDQHATARLVAEQRRLSSRLSSRPFSWRGVGAGVM